jgi:hypothetical protein
MHIGCDNDHAVVRFGPRGKSWLARDFIVSCDTSAESALATIDAARGLHLYDVILCDGASRRAAGQGRRFCCQR